MWSVVGEILPLAVGIAISPIPIIAAILMLLSPRAKGTSVGFLVGWLIGIVGAVVVFTLVSSALPDDDPDASAPITGVIKIILGLLVLLLAVKQWRGRPHGDAEPPLPKWMSAIDSLTAVRGLLLGVALSALNPKNLLMGVAAGVAIGGGGLPLGQDVAVTVIFTVLAASTVAIPVVGYLVASARLTAPLESLRAWLVHNNATVMAVLMLVLGVTTIGKGIGSF